MATDLVLAIFHHLLMFTLAAALAAETVLVRPGLAGGAVMRLGRIDRVYGLVAGLILVVGFSRVFFGLKGWEFYIYNWAFWVKIGAFVTVGLLSIMPTARIALWQRALRDDPAYAVPGTEIAHAQRFLRAQGAVFLLIPIFAAVMARGIGI